MRPSPSSPGPVRSCASRIGPSERHLIRRDQTPHHLHKIRRTHHHIRLPHVPPTPTLHPHARPLPPSILHSLIHPAGKIDPLLVLRFHRHRQVRDQVRAVLPSTVRVTGRDGFPAVRLEEVGDIDLEAVTSVSR